MTVANHIFETAVVYHKTLRYRVTRDRYYRMGKKGEYSSQRYIVTTDGDRDHPSRRRTHMNVARAMRPETFCAPRSCYDRERGDHGRVGVPGVLAGGGRVNVLRARVPGLPAPSGRGGGRNGRRHPEGFGERARERTVDVIAPAPSRRPVVASPRLTRLNAHAATATTPRYPPPTNPLPPRRPCRGSFAQSDVLPPLAGSTPTGCRRPLMYRQVVRDGNNVNYCFHCTRTRRNRPCYSVQ